ncbi:hypothetical protein B0H66DRAFT_94301 [Apodospora peruviana]|uniref:Uncharacterized protein n=1 Tax=Apodospora peruviana TaxID=516989 RepID=A0AAE0IU19_9PEZI|nr:hypothetical protein B0H66DRAFT_94301 [Apodospora peruviana]
MTLHPARGEPGEAKSRPTAPLYAPRKFIFTLLHSPGLQDHTVLWGHTNISSASTERVRFAFSIARRVTYFAIVAGAFWTGGGLLGRYLPGLGCLAVLSFAPFTYIFTFSHIFRPILSPFLFPLCYCAVICTVDYQSHCLFRLGAIAPACLRGHLPPGSIDSPNACYRPTYPKSAIHRIDNISHPTIHT